MLLSWWESLQTASWRLKGGTNSLHNNSWKKAFQPMVWDEVVAQLNQTSGIDIDISPGRPLWINFYRHLVGKTYTNIANSANPFTAAITSWDFSYMVYKYHSWVHNSRVKHVPLILLGICEIIICTIFLQFCSNPVLFSKGSQAVHQQASSRGRPSQTRPQTQTPGASM